MRLRHITVDCREPYELAAFWSGLTGWPVSAIDAPGDDEVLVEAPEPVPGLLFVRVPEPRTAKNRVHLDWVPQDRTRDEAVARAVELGAAVHEDHRGPEDRGWVTLRDPEGNEFCIEHH
ncbi:VOC family protein [Dactylosporangium sp. CS-033363]|uniref:VOC family protein n=1 Tax=Dactylosporangium sp. CS-033363 TaxID=3239935 RepID=UPI003D8DD116